MKGQTVSFDAVIAIVIFIAIVTIFFFITSHAAKNKEFQQVSSEADLIPAKLSTNASSVGFVKGSTVDESQLSKFAATDYDSLKRQLGLGYDFCLHFEDENGNTIQIDGKSGIGSDKSAACKCGNDVCDCDSGEDSQNCPADCSPSDCSP